MDEKLRPPKYAYFIYKTAKRRRSAEIISLLSVLSVAVIYSVTLASVFLTDLVLGVGFAIVTGASFVILSLARGIVNAKRPYEIYDVGGIAPDLLSRRIGLSFPSRHVFSAFLIGTMLILESWVLAAVCLLLGTIIALLRVTLLIHFPRDVIAGALIGSLAGLMGAYVLNLLI